MHTPRPSADVHAALASDAGQAAFWADTTEDANGIHFRFANGYRYTG